MDEGHSRQHQSHGRHRPYLRLAVMTALSFAAMYILMYAMVDKVSSIRPNLNQAYMAGLMTAPMVVLELLVMSMMYPKSGLNRALVGAGLVLGLVCFVAIRQQWLIGDREFLRSMIPHHSGAILMCGKAPVRDPQIRALCATIIKGQQAEIDQMDAMQAKAAR